MKFHKGKVRKPPWEGGKGHAGVAAARVLRRAYQFGYITREVLWCKLGTDALYWFVQWGMLPPGGK